MKTIQGIGGVFFRAENAEKLSGWYAEQFDLEFNHWGDAYGLQMPAADRDDTGRIAATVFSIFQCDPEHPVGPGSFRINFRVPDLDGLCERLEKAGVAFERHPDESFGRFANLTDPEGNEIELWEPPLNEGSEAE